MTLRKLNWMATERRRVWGLLTAWHLAGVVGAMPFTGVKLDPNEINPFKGHEPEDPGVTRIKEFIAKRRWAALVAAARGGK